MNRISLVGRLRTQKLLGRTVLILLAFSLLTVGGSYLFVRGPDHPGPGASDPDLLEGR